MIQPIICNQIFEFYAYFQFIENEYLHNSVKVWDSMTFRLITAEFHCKMTTTFWQIAQRIPSSSWNEASGLLYGSGVGYLLGSLQIQVVASLGLSWAINYKCQGIGKPNPLETGEARKLNLEFNGIRYLCEMHPRHLPI